MEYVYLLIGKDNEVNPGQMCVRAVVMFIVILILMRLGGSRIYSKKSALDTVIMITLGAVVAKGIVGTSPFFSTILVAITLIMVHRLLSWLATKNSRFDKLVKGTHTLLYEEGRILQKNLTRAALSEEDLHESLRLETKEDSFEQVQKAYSESNGRISFIMKPKQQGTSA